jgi:hypothetical protein
VAVYGRCVSALRLPPDGSPRRAGRRGGWARDSVTPCTIVWWSWDIAGALERARWAGARALCRVLRRLRDLIASGGGYRWIRGSSYRASVLFTCGIRVCFLAVLLRERLGVLWGGDIAGALGRARWRA